MRSNTNMTRRVRRMEELGIRFLRFDDFDVKFRMDTVLETIRGRIEESPRVTTHDARAFPLIHDGLEPGVLLVGIQRWDLEKPRSAPIPG